MFRSDSLEDALTYSHTIENQQAIFIEWNLNQSYNIEKVGNYRYRPGTTDPRYGVIRSLYEPEDLGGFYTGATDSDTIINAGFDDSNDPAFYIAPKRKMNLLYSLDDCFGQNRPRSGINKLLYLGIVGNSSGYNQYIDSLKSNRPRYYMSSRYDEFKYWTSYRTEVEAGATQEFGIAVNSGTGTVNQSYYIYDAAPFVVYKNSVPSNRVVVKMQTNVGTTNNGPYRMGNNTNVADPLYGEVNKTTPKRWAIQSLNNENNWVEIISFDENDIRSNGFPIIGPDGYVEIEYGLTVPSMFQDVFTFVGEISSISMRPDLAPNGYAYLYKESETDLGVLYISDGASWQTFTPQYGWSLSEVEVTKNTKVVKKLSSPDYFISGGKKVFREFQFTKGLRVVVDTMNKVNSTFDLIELSPRLISDITEKTSNFSIKKTLSDLGTYSMPTGNLLASTGSITIFDEDLSFNENNLFNLETAQGSIISQYSNSKIKFLFYDIVKNIDNYDYYIPIKTLYSERIPQASDNAATISMELRDLFYFFESKKSPELLLRDVSLSYAIVVLLDSIGFSNYVFKRTEGENELNIPFFFVGPDQNIAETLQQLATSSQSAMFFDEYNNLVVMSRDYVLPSEEQRDTDLTFYGQETAASYTTRTNILPNPSVEVNSTGWNGNNTSSAVRTTTDSLFGTTSIRATYNAVASGAGLFWWDSPGTGPAYPVTAGKTYTFSVYVKSNSETRSYNPTILWRDSDTTVGNLISNISGVTTSCPLNTWTRVTVTGIAPAGAKAAVITVYTSTTTTAGNNAYFDGALFEESLIAGTYFDGSFVDPASSKGTISSWSGTAHSSKSILQTPVSYYLPNIMNISSQDKLVYNGGEINYTTRYIQKSIGSISQAPYIDEYKTYVYKPVLLWEVAGQQSTKTVNEAATESSGYSLAAMPLKTTLTNNVPVINNGVIANDVMDFGESVYWLGNYSGYFYSNGEIIKYDAVEYSVAGVGNVWIKNNQEYQRYFANLKFNGKMYPTGRVRVFANVQGQIIKEHGRGQFGTEIAEHLAGLDDNSPWINDTNVRGSIQNSKEYLFNTNRIISYPNNTGIEEAGKSKMIGGKPYTSQSYAIKSTRNGIIKNFMANTNITENDVNYYKTARSGSVQTSALVFNGPDIPPEIDPAEFVTYAYKPLDKPYKHFGTRLRIIGKIESGTNQDQTSLGAFTIYSPSEISSGDPSKQVSIKGGSGGIAFGLNKDTNVGYYFEIAALSQSNVSSYTNNSNYSSYQISKSPVISVVNGLVTMPLESQHDFEIGTTVIVSGVVDDNRKTRPTSINGEYVVSAISTDRKQFTYNIKPPDITTASITAVSRTGSGSSWTITYTATNNFRSGMLVNISGLAPSGYNLTNAIVESANEKSFTVFSTTDPGAITDGVGSATYVVLSTISSNGGTVKKVIDSDTLISNIFFYKIVSGSNTADIIKKQRTGTLVTLTTLRDHILDVGEPIVVSNIDSTLNGLWEISAVTPRTIQFNTISSGTIAEADLDPIGTVTSVNKVAIPEVLWRGITDILVDDGKFTTQSRLTTSEKTTVYDLSVEYLDIGTTRQFFLYLNNKQIAVVNDTSPLPQYNNVALFVRGSSRIMFENIYALSDNFAENTARSLQLPISKIFGDELITESEAIKKYAISGIVQNTFLSGISSENPPQYSMYYEEFGTIMREAAYFNIKYDRAYPALYAKLAETLNRVRGYTVSGFIAGSYGAEFLIFNAIDKNLNLDDTTGNYLRILGIAFTQNTTHSLKVDDFFNKNSNFTEQLYTGGTDAADYQRLYSDVQNSRNKYGNNEFSIETQYVQTDAAAESMMDWIVKKIIYPRKTVGVSAFGVPHIQLGDIVQINYNDQNIDVVCSPETRFVVYNIEYSRDSGQTSTTIHLAEV